MNEKKWDEFWDNEPEEDDEQGSDVDAYNDETFENAIDNWDEDEHEEMIARDPLLSNSNKGSGWNPFGSKDLFTSVEQGQQASIGYNHESEPFFRHNNAGFQQQQQLYHQKQYRDSIQPREPPKQYALFAHVLEPMQKPVAQAPKWITVEELERQMIPTKSNNLNQQQKLTPPRPDTTNHTNNQTNQRSQFDNGSKGKRVIDRKSDYQNHRESSHNRSEKTNLFPDSRDARNNRGYARPSRRTTNREKQWISAILPPQVQLKVIENARRLFSITAMHPDEFIQDRMPTTEDGLMFKRHSELATTKANHDGVLTEKERNWLTKIQEKIQADYDDNLDEDYYYLLYFNRSSMKNEASQKPVGPGVLDRRFIPRERLLYN